MTSSFFRRRCWSIGVIIGDVAPEIFVTQWPGAGYTFQAQEVMRCLRAGEVESPMVPWRDSLAAVARARPLASRGR